MDRHLTYVAMTRHRDAVTLYAGRDELKDMKARSASLGRSGAKETVLDYTDAFAARRGLGECVGVASEIVMGPTRQRDAAQWADNRLAAHYGALGERVRSPADQQPFEETARVEVGEAQGAENGPAADERNVKVPPLVPVITHYAQTIEEVALAEASRHLEQLLGGVHSLGRSVFANPNHFTGLVSKTLRERNGDVADLAEAVAKRPEAFGALRGKAGLLGENWERRQARRMAGPLGAHVGRAARHWTRRYEEAVKSEQWKREKQDVIEVPGLSAQSEKILRQLDGLDRAEKPAFLEKLVGTPEGRRALEEAEAVADAMRQRFGTDDLRHKDLVGLTRGQAERGDLAQLAEMARITHQAQAAANTTECDLVRSQIKGLSMGI